MAQAQAGRVVVGPLTTNNGESTWHKRKLGELLLECCADQKSVGTNVLPLAVRRCPQHHFVSCHIHRSCDGMQFGLSIEVWDMSGKPERYRSSVAQGKCDPCKHFDKVR